MFCLSGLGILLKLYLYRGERLRADETSKGTSRL
jgi:hypothetical protein